MTRPLRYAVWLLIGVLLSAAGIAATLDEGIAAYRNRDFAQAAETFKALSDEGNPRATFYLSLLYAKGQGVEQDSSRSLYLLKQAAEGGDPMAQYNLGNQYNRQGAMGFDPGLAAVWWKKAAAQGLVLAQHNLGSLYVIGRGVDRDLDKARYWYRIAARNGSQKSAEALQELDRLAASASEQQPDPGRSPPSLVMVDTGWLAAHPGNRFTLQLLASRERNRIEHLVSGHAWQRELLLYKDREWQ